MADTGKVTFFSLRGRWRLRLLVAGLIMIALVVIFIANILLTQRFTETTRNRADLRLSLFATNLLSELQRNAIVPRLLAQDPELIRALDSSDYSLSTNRLLSFVAETGAAQLMMMDGDGRVVASTDRNRLGENHRSEKHFIDALRSADTVFVNQQDEAGNFQSVYSQKIGGGNTAPGVISAQVDIGQIERSWTAATEAVFVTDSEGTIILSTEPRWRGLKEDVALEAQSAPNAIERALHATLGLTAQQVDTYLDGKAVMRREARVPFQGWKIISYTTYESVRERVNGALAILVMGFAIILAALFWFASRKSAVRMLSFQKESAELRALNLALQREIAERRKVEKDLEVAEQTVEQTSKLAVLGEMSAAVSHELNQPLAAMRTYLAGARLLLQRKRADEALSSFQRIDDLIERMGAITRQLKSYARKGSDAFEPVDTRAAMSAALAMMEPQFKSRAVEIQRQWPSSPVEIFGDKLRLEQVLINLLRNAIDATKSTDDPRIGIEIHQGNEVVIQVRDNGEGIEDLDSLFEPFYTTKQPGDGVGLGLAISSGIVNDLGGRLTARNRDEGGAVFEVSLPAYRSKVAAAE